MPVGLVGEPLVPALAVVEALALLAMIP